MQIPGFTSNQDGVVISLSALDQVRLSEGKSTADIGVGLRWLQVYRQLDEHGVAVAGGRVPSVGVPGLLLGGGISFQNSQYGVGAMAVSNYEVGILFLLFPDVNHANSSRSSSPIPASSMPMPTKTPISSGP